MTVRVCLLLTIVVAVSALAAWPRRSHAEAPDPSAGAVQPSAVSRPAGGATESIHQAALAWFDGAEAKVDKLIPVAEKAAEGILAGGTLYVAGNFGFVDEMFYRAGGFPFTQEWKGENLEANDVLLVGRFRPNEAHTRYGKLSSIVPAYGRRFGRGMVVHLASHKWPQIGRLADMANQGRWGDRLALVDTGAPHGASMSDLCVGQMATTALAWAFSGELIAAATRKGKTLATYASDWEPNGRAWDASVKDKHVHPTYSVPPVQPGRIGKEYLKICRGQVAAFLTTQPEQVRLAGARMAACLKRGGVVWITCDGHIHPRGSLVPRELPGMFLHGRSYDWRYYSRRIGRSDALLYMGYLRYPKHFADAAVGRGAQAVVVAVDPGPTNEQLTSIRGCWKDYDTVIELPKYPIRVLPSSGVVQTPQWYSLMAETLAAYNGKR